ncbi:MAG: CHAT domain-containing protein [Desulfobacteraceae bacterium]|nr:CHAT domain-containing protein [Desulfobacteraceae bacterium]
MPVITIRETADFDASPNATVSFDRHGDFPVTVTNPFSQEDEKLLEWYFEEHLRFPFTNQVQAAKAAGSIRTYGESLFEQLFRKNIDVYAQYKQAVQGGVDRLSFEIIGSPEFHGLHWEALKDPDLPRAFVLDAPMVRGSSQAHTFRANVRTSPSVNLLIVTARPGGKSDVAYRTVSRPLVERLRKADLPVHIDILRPGIYRALTEHLREVRENHGVGFYHIIHFDLHGALLTFEQMQKGCETDSLIFQSRYGRSDMPEYEGRKAFLFFEGDQAGRSDPAEAGEIADLLMNHHIPIAILNACQSGKQVWDSETSLGSRLLQAGVQTVLAMGYSVTVSAASLMMEKLYEKLFRKNNLLGTICHAHTELFNQKERLAYFNYRIDLEDWMLPVVYGTGGDVALPLRDFSFEEKAAFFDRQAASFRAPEPEYGFVGRDTDILQVEKHLLSSIGDRKRNLIFIRGMGGAGKTTLLRHLGEWWQTTRFVKQVFYFGYDEKAWNVQQIMDEIAKGLFGAGPLLPGATVHPELMQFRAMS